MLDVKRIETEIYLYLNEDIEPTLSEERHKFN